MGIKVAVLFNIGLKLQTSNSGGKGLLDIELIELGSNEGYIFTG